MGVLPACKSVKHVHVWVHAKDKKWGIRSHGTGITLGCKLPHGCWDQPQVLQKSIQCSHSLRRTYVEDKVRIKTGSLRDS